MKRIIILAGLALCVSACSQEIGTTTVETKPAEETGKTEPKVEPLKEEPVKNPAVAKPITFEMQISGMS